MSEKEKRSVSEFAQEWQEKNPPPFLRLMFSREDYEHLVAMLVESHPNDHLTLRLRRRMAKPAQAKRKIRKQPD